MNLIMAKPKINPCDVWFTSKYSIFWLIGNGVVFFILSTCSLLVCRCSIDLCVLILFYETNAVISFSRVFCCLLFFCRVLGILYESESYQLQIKFHFFLSDMYAFYFLYGLIALVRTSSTISDKSCETDILSLFLILERNIVFQH